MKELEQNFLKQSQTNEKEKNDLSEKLNNLQKQKIVEMKVIISDI